MNECIFCKIAAGELPCYKVYEDDLFLGFLDIHPVSKGHTLIIPKNHYRWTYEVPEFEKYWKVSHEVTNKILKHVKPQWVQYLTHGQIPHAHIHIIPRHDVIEGAPTVPDWERPLSFSKKEFEIIASSLHS